MKESLFSVRCLYSVNLAPTRLHFKWFGVHNIISLPSSNRKCLSLYRDGVSVLITSPSFILQVIFLLVFSGQRGKWLTAYIRRTNSTTARKLVFKAGASRTSYVKRINSTKSISCGFFTNQLGSVVHYSAVEKFFFSMANACENDRIYFMRLPTCESKCVILSAELFVNSL